MLCLQGTHTWKPLCAVDAYMSYKNASVGVCTILTVTSNNCNRYKRLRTQYTVRNNHPVVCVKLAIFSFSKM